jgi:competence protein ComEC
VLLLVWFVIERPDLGTVLPDGAVFVHYIDVGQGESVLIRTPGGNMLIDTGEYGYIDKVSGYLREHGVSRIDILVATHPHSDHIGGMAEVIGDFDIGMVLMPRAEHTGRAFERMLIAMQERGLRAHAPVAGETFNLGGAEFTVLAPNSENYENLNNFSIVLRMVYGGHAFVFTGDAEGLSEREMLGNGMELSAAFLQLGHHGSKTSTTENFLDAVRPVVAVISTGTGNSYGHPHPDILDRLAETGIDVFRTDRNGDIVVETDGIIFKILTQH